MKKSLLLSLFVLNFSLLWSSMENTTHTNNREILKNMLYAQQASLMPEKAYKQFIEPYVQKAEQTLEIAKFFQQHPESFFITHYFILIAQLNVMYFRKELQLSHDCASTMQQLQNLIKDIIQKYNLTNIDIDKELDNTEKLVSAANKAYYKSLSLWPKLKITFMTKIVLYNQ